MKKDCEKNVFILLAQNRGRHYNTLSDKVLFPLFRREIVHDPNLFRIKEDT